MLTYLLPSSTYFCGQALLHSEEHKRLAREEWRDALRVYAAPFYDELLLRGRLNATRPASTSVPASTSAPASSASVSAAGEVSSAADADEAYEAWFVQWVASLTLTLALALTLTLTLTLTQR